MARVGVGKVVPFAHGNLSVYVCNYWQGATEAGRGEDGDGDNVADFYAFSWNVFRRCGVLRLDHPCGSTAIRIEAYTHASK